MLQMLKEVPAGIPILMLLGVAEEVPGSRGHSEQ